MFTNKLTSKINLPHLVTFIMHTWFSLKERIVTVNDLHFLTDELPASPDDSDNSVSESLDEFDYSVAEISRSFRSQQEICEQLNINHMIQRIFLITLDNSELQICSQWIHYSVFPAWAKDWLLETYCIWWLNKPTKLPGTQGYFIFSRKLLLKQYFDTHSTFISVLILTGLCSFCCLFYFERAVGVVAKSVFFSEVI